MSLSSFTQYFFRALAEGGIVVCTLLAITEWLLPGSVLPYVPLPIIIVGVVTLCFFVRGQGSSWGVIATITGFLLFMGLLSMVLLGDGLHVLAVLGSSILAVIILLYFLFYEKHSTLS